MHNLAAVSVEGTKLIQKINATIVNPLVILLFSAALVAFLWGVRGYVTAADNQEVRQKGAQQIMWGVIGMALMIMAFSIVRIVGNTFGFTSDPDTKQTIDSVLKGTR